MWYYITTYLIEMEGIKMAKKEGTKLCKHCKTEIPAAAKVCPNCRKKQSGIVKWIIIGFIAIAVIGSASGGGEDSNKKEDTKEVTTQNTNQETNVVEKESEKEIKEEPKEEPAEEIQYTAYTVNEMMDDLNNNPLNASDKYKGQYIEITGRLGNIDSSGKYITLYSDDEWAITGVHCRLEKNNEEQRQAVASMTMDSQITLRGKCSDVGEVLGYTLDIHSID